MDGTAWEDSGSGTEVEDEVDWPRKDTPEVNSPLLKKFIVTMATGGLPIVQFNVPFAVNKQLLPLIVSKPLSVDNFQCYLNTEGLYHRNNFQQLSSANSF